MPESFIPVWMSVGEAEEARRFLRDEARTTDGEWPEREFSLIDGALTEERQRSFDQMQAERETLDKDAQERAEAVAHYAAAGWFERAASGLEMRSDEPDPAKAASYREVAERLRSFVPSRLTPDPAGQQQEGGEA